jgi:hypothetical protein
MGWNGGGFGHMTFESGDGVAAWKAANVSHDQWTDWTDWFERPLAANFTVSEQLTALRELHDPKGSGYFVIDEQGPKVDFAFDTGEDTVRDFSGTIAATLRAAAEHGARGTFYFLGTAGAERDFTYKLELANGHSTMESLHENEVEQIYDGEDYQAFTARVMEAMGITPEMLEVPAPSAVDAGWDETPAVDPEREALKQKAAAFTAATKPAKPAVAETVEDDASAEEPAPEPAVEKPAVAETVDDDASDEEPPEPAVEKPAAKKPGVKKPAAKKVAPKKAAAKKTSPKKAAAKKAAPKKPAAKKAAAKKAVPKKATAKKAAAKKPAAKKPAAKKKR